MSAWIGHTHTHTHTRTHSAVCRGQKAALITSPRLLLQSEAPIQLMHHTHTHVRPSSEALKCKGEELGAPCPPRVSGRLRCSSEPRVCNRSASSAGRPEETNPVPLTSLTVVSRAPGVKARSGRSYSGSTSSRWSRASCP